MSAVLQHYMGDRFCPDCRARYDPVTGYCAKCEGELALWRVSAYSDEWLAHSEDPPPDAPAAVVSTRNVPDQVRRFLEGSSLVVVQRVKE